MESPLINRTAARIELSTYDLPVHPGASIKNAPGRPSRIEAITSSKGILWDSVSARGPCILSSR